MALAISVLFTLAWSAAADTVEQETAKGLAILQKDCARCHALGLTGTSPHPQAPPFRDIVNRYPVEDLEESLAEGMVSGPPD
ncbi:MAG TPA: c-type cytochrome, partial [Hyphomicrobium sp.]|nr:c-type cytochrome [Hyphomicrobium sp.]